MSDCQDVVLQTAKEHVTRPLEAEEVAVIAKAMSVLEHNWRLQRQLEEMHGLKDSTKDYRTQSTNRWRLLPYIHQLNLQVSCLMLCCGPYPCDW